MLNVDMEKLTANIQVDVVIAAAGTGSRMSVISRDLHKGLLPFNDKPVMWHIVDKVPSELSIGILLGHKSQQVRDFLEAAFPDREFTFIYVDDWTSPSAGTAYSLQFAEGNLKKNFWYLPCDGVFLENIFEEPPTESVVFVKEVDGDSARNYQTFEVNEQGRIVTSRHKQRQPDSVLAFTGIMHVRGKDAFFRELRISGEREFANCLPESASVRSLDSWLDLGNEASYRSALASAGAFDFTKPDEFTFVLPSKVIKWTPWPEQAALRTIKPSSIEAVFPDNSRASGEFFVYDKVRGSSFYDYVTEKRFDYLLTWLAERLWLPADEEISKSCKAFYQDKTLDRINNMIERLESPLYQINSVNGVEVGPWQGYLESINWRQLSANPFVAPIHGDLQFDNVIYDPQDENFRLIDWRTSFGKETLLGDVHYDFAKLSGGILINYKAVKGNEFAVENDRGAVTIDFPSAKNPLALTAQLDSKAIEMGLDLDLVKLLVPIIFWNMAPLHAEPFSLALWAFGLARFEELR